MSQSDCSVECDTLEHEVNKVKVFMKVFIQDLAASPLDLSKITR